MNTTPDEGLIQAYIDDELSDEDRRELEGRFAKDPAWEEAFRRQSEVSAELAEALALLDEIPTASGPPSWIQALTDRRARARRPGPAMRSKVPLARAAVLVLVFGGVLAAGLPGSPVRAWLQETLSPSEPTIAEGADESPPDAPRRTEEVGIRVTPAEGAVLVAIAPLPPGSEVRVRLVDGPSAGVYGPTGTRFRTGEGRVDVLNPDQVIRVEVPRALTDATITVGGEVYLQKRGDRLEVPGPVSDSTGTEILFRPPAA